jgi:hypothetical protein
VSSYVTSLETEWLATVDLAELLQVDDLLTMDGAVNQKSAPPAGVTEVPPAENPAAIEAPEVTTP